MFGRTLPQDQIVPVMQFIMTTARVLGLLFCVHSLYIEKVCDTSSRMHVRVTSMDRWCLVAHSGDNACLRIFLTRLLHLAAGMGRHVGQWTVQRAPGESLVHGLDTLLGDSHAELRSQCAAFGQSGRPTCVSFF